MKALRSFVVLELVVLAACTPAERETIREVTPAAEKATCVLIRAFSTSGSLDEICATADELAPLVPQLLADRADGDGRPSVPTTAAVAFALPPPSRPAPRRRCVQWVEVSRDGGTDARP